MSPVGKSSEVQSKPTQSKPARRRIWRNIVLIAVIACTLIVVLQGIHLEIGTRDGYINLTMSIQVASKLHPQSHARGGNSSSITDIGRLVRNIGTPARPLPGHFLYVGVLSAPSNFDTREDLRSKYVKAVRETLGETFGDAYIRIEFVIGHASNRLRDRGDNLTGSENDPQRNLASEELLRNESRTHGDIFRIPLQEAYENLADKTLLLVERAVEAGYRFIVKIDDDHILNLVQLFDVLEFDNRPLCYGGGIPHFAPKHPTQVGVQGEFVPYYGGPSYFLSWELAWRITKLHSTHSASFMYYGSSSEDVDMGFWVRHEMRTAFHKVEYMNLTVGIHDKNPRNSLEHRICIANWLRLCMRLVDGKLALHSQITFPFVLHGNGMLRLDGDDLCIAAVRSRHTSHLFGNLQLAMCDQYDPGMMEFMFCKDMTLRLRSEPHMCVGMEKRHFRNGSILSLDYCHQGRMQQFVAKDLNVTRVHCPAVATASAKVKVTTAEQDEGFQVNSVVGSCFLYVGVLSAPLNFKQRAEVRKSYLTRARQLKGIVAEFVVGHEHFWERAQGSLGTRRQFLLEHRLQDEAKQHGDIRRVPIVDSREHLQDKFFIHFAHGADIGCTYIAKVNDDRYVDVSMLGQIFSEKNMQHNMLYSGDHLRHNADDVALGKQKVKYFSGGFVVLSLQLAWLITKVYAEHSLEYLLYGGKEPDADLGYWIDWVHSRRIEVHYKEQLLSRPLIALEPNASRQDDLEEEVFWRIRIVPYTFLCWNIGEDPSRSPWVRLGGRLALGICALAQGQHFSLRQDGTIRPIYGDNRCLTTPTDGLTGDNGVLNFLDCWEEHPPLEESHSSQKFKFHEDGTIRPQSAPEFCIRVTFVGVRKRGGKLRFVQCGNPIDAFEQFLVRRA